MRSRVRHRANNDIDIRKVSDGWRPSRRRHIATKKLTMSTPATSGFADEIARDYGCCPAGTIATLKPSCASAAEWADVHE